MEKDIKLQLTADEINLVLEGLGNLQFVRVFQLIGKIQEQASEQLAAGNGQAKTEKPVLSKS